MSVSIELAKPELIFQFLGAVKTRISDRQKAMWSRFIGAGFIAEDILGVWPDNDMQRFSIRLSGNPGMPLHWNLSQLNLRELDELAKWLNDFIYRETTSTP